MAKKTQSTAPKPQRLNQYLASHYGCSRRQADTWIAEGLVSLNRKPVTVMATHVAPQDDVQVKGQQPLRSTGAGVLALHKPAGYITTRRDELGRPTIYDLLPEQYRAYKPVGRLDRDSSGLLLLTNQGPLLYQLTHPKFHIPKTYRVTLDKTFLPHHGKVLTEGVLLKPEGVVASFHALSQHGPKQLEVVLHTGLNRQIRRSFQQLGYEVKTLRRLAVGPITLAKLPAAKWRLLRNTELVALTQCISANLSSNKEFSGEKSQQKPRVKKSQPV